MIKQSKRLLSAILALLMIASVSGVAGAANELLTVKYDVTPVTDGGGYVLMVKTQYSPGEKVVARAVPNDGFAFYSWSSDDIFDPNFETYKGNDMIEFIMPAQDVTLGAIFAIKQPEQQTTVSVTYDSMGGTDFGTTYVAIGAMAPMPSNVPVKEGYTFEGWYADSTCTLPFDFTIPLYASTFIYAKWAPVQTIPTVENGFSDVKENDWFYNCVMTLADRNIISGMGNGIFAPQKNISRAQLATILANLANANLADTATPFEDVPESAWYAKAVSWAYTNGIVNGLTEKTFAPDANVTRQDMAVMIMRYADKVAKETLVESNAPAEFADDAEIAAYAKEAVYKMQRAGIIGGKPGNLFDAKAYATRAEASKMIFVLLNLLEM
ncbi:MAG: S-layer homology domain-containing protein [Oscillospiraceae bacterium]|nr:S-layer homology domain-containing protein [Oscillospiraceae bacterium]